MKDKYRELMNSQELEPINQDWNKEIKEGTLIGFKGLGGKEGITAAYPVWRVIKDEIQFVLFHSQDTGRPCIDNTWFGSSELYINKEPIIVSIDVQNPESFGMRLSSFFPTKAQLEENANVKEK